MSPHVMTIMTWKNFANRAAAFRATPRRLSFRATLVQKFWNMLPPLPHEMTGSYLNYPDGSGYLHPGFGADPVPALGFMRIFKKKQKRA